MTLENTIHEYVCQLAEEAMEQIDIEYPECWAAIKAKREWMNDEISDLDLLTTREKVEVNGEIRWVSERLAVKDAVRAASLRDPIKALKETRAAHLWVMSREKAKEFGREIINELLENPKEKERLFEKARKAWVSISSRTRIIDQNKKLVEMILGDSNG